MRELNGGVFGEKPIGRRKAVPVIYVRGSHYEVGYDVGRSMGSLIRDLLSKFQVLMDLEKEYKTEAGQQAYDKTLANMKKRFPYYVKEMQGVADGAEVPFYQLFLLQMDDIMDTINDNHVPRNDTGGCSSIAINNLSHTILGHTEDAFTDTLNHFYIMSAHIIPTPEDRKYGEGFSAEWTVLYPSTASQCVIAGGEEAAEAMEERFASLCYAGHMPGYTMGYNENGLVFSINTLSPLVLKPGNTPRTFITRKLLSAQSYNEAEKILLDEGLGIGNGFSVNMIWSDNWGNRKLANVEVSPDLKADKSVVTVKKYDKDPLVHCNIYQHTNVTEVSGMIVDSSRARLKTIHAYPPPKNRRDIARMISDTTGEEYQVFSQKDDAIIKTIAAGIFDLDKRTWSIYIDKPESSEPIAILPIRFSILENII